MNEKLLINGIRNINVVPSAEWKQGQRDIFVAQIYQGAETGGLFSSSGVKPAFVVALAELSRLAVRPAIIALSAILAVALGSAAGLGAAKNTKPGDALYYAKIVRERTQLALTFNERQKARLGIEFAQNRTAEMARVMSEPPSAGQQAAVNDLAENAKNEISAARDRLNKIADNIISEKSTGQAEQKSDKKSADKKIADVKNIAPEKPAVKEQASGQAPKNLKSADTRVFSANTGKASGSLEIDVREESAVVPPAGKASTSAQNSASKINNEVSDINNILKEAQVLIESDNFHGTASKLDEASRIIEKMGDEKAGEVKGADEKATSTE
jgi:hypothetical protein